MSEKKRINSGAANSRTGVGDPAAGSGDPLDLLLDLARLPEPPTALREEILAQAETVIDGRAGQTPVRPWRAAWRPASVWAVSLAAGIAIGVYVMPVDSPDLVELEISQSILG